MLDSGSQSEILRDLRSARWCRHLRRHELCSEFDQKHEQVKVQRKGKRKITPSVVDTRSPMPPEYFRENYTARVDTRVTRCLAGLTRTRANPVCSSRPRIRSRPPV